MFTGIIQAVGKIAAMEQRGGDVRLYVKTGVLDLGDVALGDSIATNGVCLTVIELPGDGFGRMYQGNRLNVPVFGSQKPGWQLIWRNP